ncbi:protein PLANT CADMIUM RESISTANCE 4-like [Prunus dulcis]|nr:protein PLANT CADMIUM RESISTANCE 4-like [Prunus dulcis]
MTPQPGAAAQFPPQNVQSHPNPMYGNGANQPGAYPPQAPQQSPAKFPPASPSTPHQVRYQQQQPQQAQAGYINVNAGNANAMPDNNYAAQGVPVQQPHYQPGPLNHINLQNVGTEGWSSELFDCMDDPMNALTTAFVPCLTFGQIAEIVDNGTTSCAISGLFYGLIASFLGVPFIMSCTYRTKLRSMFRLVEAPAPDWVTHLFCEPCALCQEYRELQIRGIDPSIGWIGNLQRNPNLQQQLRANMMAPPPPQYMNHNCQ